MIDYKLDGEKFFKDMQNILGYAEGFAEGAKDGKEKFLKGLGSDLSELIKNFIDSNARVNPAMLHHVYEWYQVGQPGARLFDIDYIVTNGGLTFLGTLSQSNSIKIGSTTPFYDKARIMEEGVPVTIKPKRSTVLRFEDNGQIYYVSGKVSVDNPGGMAVEGGFQKVFESFFNNSMTQSFLQSSGIARYLETPAMFKANLRSGKRGGKSVGYQIGYNWITKASGGVV